MGVPECTIMLKVPLNAEAFALLILYFCWCEYFVRVRVVSNQCFEIGISLK